MCILLEIKASPHLKDDHLGKGNLGRSYVKGSRNMSMMWTEASTYTVK